MGVRVAYGKKGRISAAIASGTIPKDSLIITSDNKESELYFYDANGEMKNISERKQFETLTEAQAWVKTYDCAGHIISVHNGSDWVPYIVSADGKLSPVNTGDISVGDVKVIDTVAGHTQDIQNLQTDKADKATTLEGYGITDAMTATAIAEAIKTAIAETGHASFTKVDAVPTAAEAKDNVLYLVMNADTGFYDIYAKVDTEVVRLDDVSVNLDNYSTTEQMNEAIATAIANKVDKVEGKGFSTEDFTTALKEKLVALPEGAEANYVKSVSDEFTVSEEGKLEVKEIAPAKVMGLPDALAGKVDKVEGKGLSANDYTDEEKEKLGGVEAGANKNLIEIIKLAGAALNISEKAVDIPLAGETAGVVTSSTEENKVAVAKDGSMEVNSLNMNKLVQSEGDTLILDGGNASV